MKNGYFKKVRVFFCILIAAFILPAIPGALYATEVERIEDSEVPPEMEAAIEIKPEPVKPESEFKLIPMVDITTLGTWSKVSSGGDVGGVDARGTIAPVMRLDKNNYIIPLYYGSYNRERQIVVEEEGGVVYNAIMDHNVTLEYKHIMNEQVTLRGDGIMRLHYVKESGYKWTDGLYDYRDFGAGLSAEYALTKTAEARSSITAGGEYYFRNYPNYKSLISLASVTAPETDEKDYNGYRPILKYNYANAAFGCDFMYSPLYKDYTDKKVIDSNGVLTDKRRHDWFHYTNLNLSYLFKDVPFALGLGLTGIINDSNQNYYDSISTTSLSDDVFTSNYYSFKSLNTNPKLTYIHRLEGKKSPATITAGYAFLIRDYDHRKAQNISGIYLDEKQRDKNHTATLQGVYPVTDNISAVAVGTYTKGTSNMEYESYYRYEYDSWFAGGGIRIKY